MGTIVLRRVVICMALMVVLLSGGCEIDEISPKEESKIVLAIVLAASIGVIISSWLVIILLTLLGRRLNLVRNRAVLLQYGVYLLIQIITSLSMGILEVDSFIIILSTVVVPLIVALVAIPYLLLIGGLLILVLPLRLLAWVPSFLLLPHYLMFGLMYVTNDVRLRDVESVTLMAKFAVDQWYVVIPAGVAILVGLIFRRKMLAPGHRKAG